MMRASRRVAVVTGATGGMGGVIAVELARRGMHVVTTARDPARAESLRRRIEATAGTLEVVAVDLSDRAGLVAAAEDIRSRHDEVSLLINNAGAHYAEHRLSPDGLEMHVAVDYLAGFGLSVLLERELRAGRARVVNVASDTLRDTRRVKLGGRARPATLDLTHLDDLTAISPAAGFVPFEAYARAKLLTVTSGYHLARTLAGEVTVTAVHPGIMATAIVDDLIPALLRPFRGAIRRLLITPEEGAASVLRLALDPDLDGVTGRYFARDEEVQTPAVSYDLDAQERLHAASARFVSGS